MSEDDEFVKEMNKFKDENSDQDLIPQDYQMQEKEEYAGKSYITLLNTVFLVLISLISLIINLEQDQEKSEEDSFNNRDPDFKDEDDFEKDEGFKLLGEEKEDKFEEADK
jgi:hypothetical protein